MSGSLRIALATVILAWGCGVAVGQPTERLVAADISSISRVRDSGGVFSTFRGQTELVEAMKDAGYNTVRLRVWVDPEERYSELDDALTIATAADAAGLDVWLNLHFSDTWADPGQQTKPAAWAGLSFEELVAQVRMYTMQTVEAFEAAGLPLTYIQLGNEIQDGMLWPDGQISVNGYGPFIELLGAAIDGLKQADLVRDPYVIVHSGGPIAAPSFFDELDARGVAYDIAAISYYPYFHGVVANLESALVDLVGRTDKPLLIAEIGYPWTFGFGDGVTNLVGSASIPPGVLSQFPATPAGQAAYVDAVWNIADAVPDGRGIGVAYWEPAWLPGVVGGSALENLALFNFGGTALPAFDGFAHGASPVDGQRLGLDPIYAPPLAVQTRDPAVSSDQETQTRLDTLFASQAAGDLWLAVSGRLETDAGTLFIFIDADPSAGNDTLSLPPDLQNGWSALDGLRFDVGFAPELAVALTPFGSTVFVDLFDLSGATAAFSYLGSTPIGGGDRPLQFGSNPLGLRVAYDDSGAAGANDMGCSRPLGSTRGIEVHLPRGLFSRTLSAESVIGVSAFFVIRTGVSPTQWLPAVPGSVEQPLDVSGLDLRDVGGLQHVITSLDADTRGPAVRATADLNGDGVENPEDMLTLLTEFARGRRFADINADGALDFFDVLDALTLLDDPCP
ncbi:MAG: glycosyl hydrolase 53 family protein [Planctomycetota bacterium]